jgi:hypothetical protein
MPSSLTYFHAWCAAVAILIPISLVFGWAERAILKQFAVRRLRRGFGKGPQ